MSVDDWASLGITDKEPWEVPDEPIVPKTPPKTPQRSKKAEPDFIEVTTHKFKSNIAHYMRLCDTGAIKGVILMRYNVRVGVYIPYTLDR